MLNEKEVSLEDLKSLLGGLSKYIDLVRIAVDPANFSRSILFIGENQTNGFRGRNKSDVYVKMGTISFTN